METDLAAAYVVHRLEKALTCAKEVFPDNAVRILTGEGAEVVGLFIDGTEIATFGPGHPVEAADALYSFINHLVTRVTAEA